MLPEPIARHSYPRSVSDSAFEQLVDGVKLEGTTKTKGTPVYQPKDGDISGIIQVTEATWIILKREGVLPARPHDNKDPALRKQMHDMIFEAKVQETIGDLYDGLMRDAAIENRLTGQVKPAGAEELSPTQLGGEVKLMSNPAAAAAAPAASAAPVDPATIPASGVSPAPPGQAAPAGVSAEDAQRASNLNKKP
jgi:foldase protein PrsA